MPEFTRVLEKNGVPITLKFKDFALLPSEISRRFRGRSELQLWAGFEWGLIEPTEWPIKAPVPVVEGETPPAPKTSSSAIEDGLFDGIPIRTVMKIHSEWQDAADVNAGESTASSK